MTDSKSTKPIETKATKPSADEAQPETKVEAPKGAFRTLHHVGEWRPGVEIPAGALDEAQIERLLGLNAIERID